MKIDIYQRQLDGVYFRPKRKALGKRLVGNGFIDSLTVRANSIPPPPFAFLRLSGKGIIALALIILLIAFQARALSAFEAHVINVTAEIHQINAPVADPPGGAYTEEEYSVGVPVTLTVDDPTDGPLTIYYTLDGTEPACDSELSGGSPINIDIYEPATLQAIACDDEGHKSLVTTAAFALLLKLTGGGDSDTQFQENPIKLTTETDQQPPPNSLAQQIIDTVQNMMETIFTPSSTLETFEFPTQTSTSTFPLVPTTTPLAMPDVPTSTLEAFEFNLLSPTSTPPLVPTTTPLVPEVLTFDEVFNNPSSQQTESQTATTTQDTFIQELVQDIVSKMPEVPAPPQLPREDEPLPLTKEPDNPLPSALPRPPELPNL